MQAKIPLCRLICCGAFLQPPETRSAFRILFRFLQNKIHQCAASLAVRKKIKRPARGAPERGIIWPANPKFARRYSEEMRGREHHCKQYPNYARESETLKDSGKFQIRALSALEPAQPSSLSLSATRLIFCKSKYRETRPLRRREQWATDSGQRTESSSMQAGFGSYRRAERAKFYRQKILDECEKNLLRAKQQKVNCVRKRFSPSGKR